jgi:uncharacterized membrane protein YedE/YeeE
MPTFHDRDSDGHDRNAAARLPCSGVSVGDSGVSAVALAGQCAHSCFMPGAEEISLELKSILGAVSGGALIGLATAVLLILNGRIAGISGIVAGLLRPRSGEIGWRLLFVGGLIAGGLLARRLLPDAFESSLPRSPAALVVAGVLVGFGASLGGGCTSGHGVCGLGRLSLRSLVATLTFIATGAMTASLIAHVSRGGR